MARLKGNRIQNFTHIVSENTKRATLPGGFFLPGKHYSGSCWIVNIPLRSFGFNPRRCNHGGLNETHRGLLPRHGRGLRYPITL